jgi:hypothetical protein
VTEGLEEGEQVVLNNQYRLAPGARVRSEGPTPTTNARSGNSRPKVNS